MDKIIIENREDGELKQVLKGKPSTCHPEKSVFCRGLCKNCYNKWLLENNPEYVKKQKENHKNWMKSHINYKKEYDKKYIAKQEPDYNRIRLLRSKYNLTIDDYEALLKKQNGGCAICGNKPKEGKNLHIDHCHETGVLRGLLCFRCNFGLSYFGENKSTLEKAFLYLKDNGSFLKEVENGILEKIVLKKEQQIQDTFEKERIFKNAKKIGIPLEDKIKIRDLHKNGKQYKEIKEIFPMYCRTSIYCAMRGKKRNGKLL
jgi:hypothetical protein